ncbi:MAG TPA: pirin family protein [Thermoplasmata archaeon]
MSEFKEPERIQQSRPTIEGAGVRLKRVFGPREAPLVDPFLLLDDFHSSDPKDYVAGFPWHPHRGIETVTYMISGVVEHGDSIGNKGAINSGDVQWMTAGNGILHQEMPQRYEGMMQGFQLWVNLPSSKKMMSPRYRDVSKSQIPTHAPSRGIDIKVIAGEIGGTKGPVQDLVVRTEYFDVGLGPGVALEHSVEPGHRTVAYVYEGAASFGKERKNIVGSENLVVLGQGRKIAVKADRRGARFLLASGAPLRERIAWGGPIVMNTQDELDLAFRELSEGTFIKTRQS